MLTVRQLRRLHAAGAIAMATPPYDDETKIIDMVYQEIEPIGGQPWDWNEARTYVQRDWDLMQTISQRLVDLVHDALRAEDETGFEGSTLIEDPSNHT